MYKRIFAVMAAVLLLAVMAAAQDKPEVVQPAAGISIEPVLCTGIMDREPVGAAESFPAEVDKVYLWTKVTGAAEGETTIHHVWLREGQEMADVELPVRGTPWRTYSYKTIPPEWAGNWEVKVTGADGNVIKSVTFTVGAKPAETKTE